MPKARSNGRGRGRGRGAARAKPGTRRYSTRSQQSRVRREPSPPPIERVQASHASNADEMDKFVKTTAGQRLGRHFGMEGEQISPKVYTLDEAKAKLDEILQFLDKDDAEFYMTHYEDIVNGFRTLASMPIFLTGSEYDGDYLGGKFQANMKLTAAYLEKTKFAQIFITMTIQHHEYLKKNSEPIFREKTLICLKNILISIRNYTDKSEILARDFGKFGGVEAILNLLDTCSSVDKFEKVHEGVIKSILQRSLGILHNCIREWPDNRGIYRNANAVKTLTNLKDTFCSESYMCSKVLLLLILSYIVDEKESESLAKSEDCVQLLTSLLDKAAQQENHYAKIQDGSETFYFCAFEILDGLNHLAINDSNKIEIEKQGALSSVIRMLQPDFSDEERQAATEMLWMLAFLEGVRKNKDIQASVTTLRSQTASENPKIREASTYALWEIQDNQRPCEPPPSYDESARTHVQQLQSGHVMLSYQWDSQERVLLIRDRLQQEGYNVWMDVDRLRGDMLEAMASAVEKADVILICMTEKYKDSKMCRSEAAYASKKDKPIIPLLLEANYDPDGWLGLLMAYKLYYKFIEEQHFQSSMEKLIKEIGDRGRRATDEIDSPKRQQISVTEEPSPSVPNPGDDMTQAVINAAEWSTEQVQSWLQEIGLPELCSRLDFCDGKHLKEMYIQYQQSPDVFRNELKTDLGLNFRGLIKFTTALGQVFKSEM